MGGSDQWGNITAGIDLIRKLRGAAHGLVPLVTTASSEKFGKTEGGTVWLDPALTPHEFYQFWFNADDRDVARYLKFFTFLDAPAVAALEAASARDPRSATRSASWRVRSRASCTGTTRGSGRRAAAEVVPRRSGSSMSVAELLQIFPNVPSCDLAGGERGLARASSCCAAARRQSKSEARAS